MKSKMFGKKLTLNRKTVADLNIPEMKRAYGGIGCTAPWTNCDFCGTLTCGSGNPLCPCAAGETTTD